MENNISAAFDLSPLRVQMDKLEETSPKRGYRDLASYQTIFASVKEIGILQPIVVCPSKKVGVYKILDGHLRYYALRELGFVEADCIVSLDDERYTFDAQINYLNAIQRSKMILKAVKNGLSPERIAKTLNIDVKKILNDMNATEGIDEKAKDILKASPVSNGVLNALKKVKSIRQIQIAEAMLNNHNFGIDYVKGLILSTQASLRVDETKPVVRRFHLSEIIENMGFERSNVQARVKEVMPKYNEDVYELTTIISFLRKILENPILSSYLMKHFSDKFELLKKIAESNKLE